MRKNSNVEHFLLMGLECRKAWYLLTFKDFFVKYELKKFENCGLQLFFTHLNSLRVRVCAFKSAHTRKLKKDSNILKSLKNRFAIDLRFDIPRLKCNVRLCLKESL